MKVSDITEQLRRRRSPEEIAAQRAAPGYWKGSVRDEFNAILKKYGATSRETARGDDATLNFERQVNVLVSGQDSMTLHRDKRARALLVAIGKWLLQKAKDGYGVSVGFWGFKGRADAGLVKPDHALESVMRQLNDATRIEPSMDWLNSIGDRGEKLPVRFDLRMSITKPPTG